MYHLIYIFTNLGERLFSRNIFGTIRQTRYPRTGHVMHTRSRSARFKVNNNTDYIFYSCKMIAEGVNASLNRYLPVLVQLSTMVAPAGPLCHIVPNEVSCGVPYRSRSGVQEYRGTAVTSLWSSPSTGVP